MADTLYTSDGKMHILIGSTDLISLIREYMGDDAAQRVAGLEYQVQKQETQFKKDGVF